jgi:hypothetical protein
MLCHLAALPLASKDHHRGWLLRFVIVVALHCVLHALLLVIARESVKQEE